MEQKIQKELDLIKESILKAAPTEAIYLFGSHAYGTPSEDSDIDIYVVVSDDAGDLIDLRADIRLDLWDKNTRDLDLLNIDLLIGKTSVFNRRKEGPTLERKIAREGVLLYG